MGAWKWMVLSYTHPYTNTVSQGRTRTRLCVPSRQSLLFADGPLVAPQLATKSIPLQLAAMPLSLACAQSPWRERAAPRNMNTSMLIRLISYSIILLQACFILLFSCPRRQILRAPKEKPSPACLKKRIALCKHVVVWQSGLKQKGVGCLSEVLYTLTHTCTHTHINTRLNHYL